MHIEHVALYVDDLEKRKISLLNFLMPHRTMGI